MLTRQISFSAPIFVIVFLVQEAGLNQFKLPGGGFSLFVIFALVWAIMSTPEIAALSGFAAGILMDLSQSSDGPFGQWTLIMVIVCYGVSYLGYGDSNINGNPIGVVFFVVIANLASEVIFIASGVLLGVSTGSFGQTLLVLLGNSVWTLVVTPIVLPIFSYLHGLIFEKRAK
ncbi:MAG: rod shape-determining protein MreD [Actinomycetes bacterium]